MHCWLHLRLSAPLMTFGGVAIDQIGPTRDMPAASALTGLLGNALGWHWRETGHHQALQDRLVFGALLARPGRPLADSQNAQLAKTDKGWTTRGAPEGRDGASYGAPHRRQRHYLADACVHVVLRLDPADPAPTLDDLATALDCPARPLFIGRKPCLPTAPLNAGWICAETALAALRQLAETVEAGGGALLLSAGEGEPRHARHEDLADLRNWQAGVHAGSRPIIRGWL